ncbi:hypothetical protein [Chitinophaga sp.]|uniref:hypothetical protein n=1 Tax=Chitinophaga sp. TaxID=1869181 RepID=UPI0031D68979
MKIGEIGNRFLTTEKVSYISNRTLLDFDFLVVDLDFIAASNVSKPTVLKRLNDIEEFFRYKNVPLIVYPPGSESFISTTNGVRNVHHIFEAITTIKTSFLESVGSKFNIVANTTFLEFFEKYKDYFSYSVVYDTFSGKRLLETPHSQKVISFINDQFIVLPALNLQKVRNDERNFLELLTKCIISYKQSSSELILPAWIKQYYLPGELDIISQIDKIQSEINDSQRKLNDQKVQLMLLERYKSLLTASGTQLEVAVKQAFEEMGIEIIEAEENRDDLIIKYKDQIIVIEIKGVAGSAAEKYAAQLEKWVTTYYAEKEIKPKGVLIVNAFKDMTLKDRPKDVFPHQMLKFSAQREHCLISAQQFLGLFLATKTQPDKKEELLDTLFTTVGCYQHFQNWQDFVTPQEI